jgi:hypothetical protein
VPPPTPGNLTVTLSDGPADIATSGTATVSNVQISLGATSGTVTATVAGGASGGRVTNCAHLTSPGATVSSGGFTFTQVGALNLSACSEIDVGAVPQCTPGLGDCGWPVGSLVTYDQDAYGDATTAAGMLVSSKFYTAALSGAITIGIDGTTGFSAVFDSPNAVFLFLPQTAPPATLVSDALDPDVTHSGIFGGDLLALTINVELSDAGALGGTTSTRFGDLYICGYSVTAVNGQTVRQFLATANTVIGGGAGPISATAADAVAGLINSAFIGGVPSSFAQANLYSTPCP